MDLDNLGSEIIEIEQVESFVIFCELVHELRPKTGVQEESNLFDQASWHDAFILKGSVNSPSLLLSVEMLANLLCCFSVEISKVELKVNARSVFLHKLSLLLSESLRVLSLDALLQ